MLPKGDPDEHLPADLEDIYLAGARGSSRSAPDLQRVHAAFADVMSESMAWRIELSGLAQKNLRDIARTDAVSAF